MKKLNELKKKYNIQTSNYINEQDVVPKTTPIESQIIDPEQTYNMLDTELNKIGLSENQKTAVFLAISKIPIIGKGFKQ